MYLFIYIKKKKVVKKQTKKKHNNNRQKKNRDRETFLRDNSKNSNTCYCFLRYLREGIKVQGRIWGQIKKKN